MDSDNRIAIIGVGCRFPGSDDVDAFWKTLINGENHITEIPADRWNINAFYSPDGGDGKYYCNKAGLISSGSAWDNRFFGINDMEAGHVDPQHRLVLECVHMALEDAGMTNKHMSGTRTGVYVGLMNHGAEIMNSVNVSRITNNTVTGSATSICSNRISFIYHLTGPSVTMDSACSASIVALHTACQGMRNGDCDMAIVGGVNRILTPHSLIGLSQASMMSRTGQCHTFSSKADGYTRSEGCGFVLLKPLKRAIDDRNKIWGTIVGTAVNHDGRSVTPITKPSYQQQKALMEKLLRECNVDPNDVGYLEAHGTGTKVGDPVEAGALIDAYGAMRDPDSPPCYVGSSKSNIGHTESAAGMAGLIKVLLMMKHAKIVPSLHYKENPNRNIQFLEGNLRVATEVDEWSLNKDGKRLAGINCFGFGGTNSHLLLEGMNTEDIVREQAQPSFPLVVALSATETESLRNNVLYCLTNLKREHESLESFSYTSTVRRNHYAYRIAVPFTATDELKFKLEQCLLAEPNQSLNPAETHIVFVFCGMGTTWEGMGINFMNNHPSFNSKVTAVNEIFTRLSGESLVGHFSKLAPTSSPRIVQPILFAYQVAICELLKEFGVVPHAIVGHSVGEVAAAHIGGALDLEEAVRIIYHRGRLQAKVTGGKMLVVGKLAVDQVEDMCKPFSGRLCIAAYNSATSCTISGDADAVESMFQTLTSLDQSMGNQLFLRILPVSSAFHSHHIDPIYSELIESVGLIPPKGKEATSGPSIYSTVSGDKLAFGKLRMSQYWANNMRNPVLFNSAFNNALHKNKTNIVIEIGPKPALRANVAEICAQKVSYKHFPSANVNSELLTFITTICEMYQLGIPVRWESLFVNNFPQVTNIPRYQFSRKLQPIETEFNIVLEGVKPASHPFMRMLSKDPIKFEASLNAEELSFVRDHLIFDESIAPGALHAELCLFSVLAAHAPRETIGDCTVDVELLSPLNTKQNTTCTVEVSSNESNLYEVIVKNGKKLLSRCSVGIGKTPKRKDPVNVDYVKLRSKQRLSGEDVYRKFHDLGFKYGPSLTGIENCWVSEDEVLTKLKVPDDVMTEVPALCLHPALLDMLFQSSLPFVGEHDDFSLKDGLSSPHMYIPKEFRGLVVHGNAENHMYCYLQLIEKNQSQMECGGALLNSAGHVVVECPRLILKNTANPISDRLFYTVEWAKQDVSQIITSESGPDKAVVVFSNTGPFSNSLCNSLNGDVTQVSANSTYGELFTQTQQIPAQDETKIANFLRQFSTLVYCWGFGHNDDTLTVDDIDARAKFACNGLRNIYTTMEACGINLAVVIVTLNTQFCNPGFQTSVSGSELWGMARCLQREINTTESPIVLIDMGTCSRQEITYLSSVIQNPHQVKCSEIALRKSAIYFNTLRRVDEDIKNSSFRINKAKPDSVPLKLLSSGDEAISNVQYVSTNQLMKTDEQNVVVSISSFSHHDGHVLPNVVSEREVPPLNLGTEQFVTAVDLIGRVMSKKNKHFKEGTEVVICYPTVFQSLLNVPESCLVPLRSVPKKCRPLLSLYVLLWDLLNVKVSVSLQDKVLILHSQDESKLAVMLRHVLKHYSDSVTTCTSEEAEGLAFDAYDLIMLMTSSCTALGVSDNLLNRIINVQELFQTGGVHKHWMNPPYLKTALPSTVKWLKQLDKNGVLPYYDVMDVEYREPCPETVNRNSNQHSVLQVRLECADRCPVLCKRNSLFDIHAMYLVVGGHSGLGRELVRFLASRHAGHVVILSRRKPEKEEIDFMTKVAGNSNSKISCVQADITDIKSLSTAVNKLRLSHPCYSIKGVFTGAMLLSDALIQEQSFEDFEKVLNPKILGTLNLHIVTQNDPLDYFVMHSSVVSVLGNHGQTNYGAANSFMDSFAFYRRQFGMAAQTINWGPLALGALEGKESLIRVFSLQGMEVLSVNEIHHCLEGILLANFPQVIVWNVNWTKYAKSFRHLSSASQEDAATYRIRSFIEGATQGRTSSANNDYEFKDEDKQLAPAERLCKLLNFLQFFVSEILVVNVNVVSFDAGLASLGVDSNLAVEIRNVVLQHTGYTLSVMSLIGDAVSVRSLAEEINNFLE